MEQDRALRVLEFTKIREMLAQHAITEEGRQRCLELVPCHDLGDVNHALAETEEAVVLLTYLGQNPLVSYPDVRESIARAQKGACLSPRMLLDVSAFLRAARAARSALVRDRDDTPILTGLASRLTVLERVETDINDAILSEEEIADRASTELYQIRRQIRGANERMRDKLNQMIRSSSFAKNLQDSIITMRGDRYCIPVKAECRANVQSASPNYVNSGYHQTIACIAVSKACHETILTKGVSAKLAAEQGLCTKDVEDVIEANTLLSGLGVQNGSCAGAHSIAEGITVLEPCAKLLHGEVVAFGILVQLIVEGAPAEELDELYDFFEEVGLPTTFDDLGIPDATEADIRKVAETSMHSYWDVEPFAVNPQMVFDGIMMANTLGKRRKGL